MKTGNKDIDAGAENENEDLELYLSNGHIDVHPQQQQQLPSTNSNRYRLEAISQIVQPTSNPTSNPAANPKPQAAAIQPNSPLILAPSIKQQIRAPPHLYTKNGSRSNLQLRNLNNSSSSTTQNDNQSPPAPESHSYTNRQSHQQQKVVQLPSTAVNHLNAAARQLQNINGTPTKDNLANIMTQKKSSIAQVRNGIDSNTAKL